MKNRNTTFYILVVLVLAAIAGLIVLLAPGSAPETPPVVLSAPPSPTPSAPAASEETPEESVLEINADTVQTVIALLRRSDSYARTLTVQSFWNGGSAETEYQVWVRGEETRVDVRDDTGLERHILLRDGEKWIWYSDGEGVYHGPAGGGDADAYQTIPSYEDVLSLPREAILSAAYEDYNGETAVTVRYVSGPFGYETVCHVSDGSGLAVGAEIYDGDVLIYTMRSGPVDISTPDDALFQPPESAAN